MCTLSLIHIFVRRYFKALCDLKNGAQIQSEVYKLELLMNQACLLYTSYLLMDLGASDEQLECPILFCCGRQGTASLDPDCLLYTSRCV